MAAKMNDFVLEYYKRLIFRNMPIEQFSQFCDQVKRNDFSGNMKKWSAELLEQDPAHPGQPLLDPDTGVYVRKPLPDPMAVGGEWELTDAEWTKLFNAFQTAFRNMATDRADFKDNKDATKFLDTYFGIDNTVVPAVSRLFNYATANTAADNAIQGELKTFLTTYQSSMEFHFKDWGITDENTSYDDILNGINSRKYNTDPKFQSKIREIARYIEYYSTDTNFITSLRLHPGDRIPNVQDIKTGFDTTVVDPYKLNDFKLSYDDLLRKVHTVPNIYDVFKNNDKGKITGQLDKARDFLKYSDPNSPDFVRPKRDDELTLVQKISDWWGKTYEDCFEKYIKFTGDRLYFSPEAKSIVAGLNKEKVKPTDGLSAVIKAGSKIQGALKDKGNFRAAKHTKWFVETLGEFEKDPNMKNIFAGALKNASQMKGLIRELVIKAVREGKKDEAKTAMEVLSVIKYGFTTSKVMDALKTTDIKIFSDKGLSWNKNNVVQVITNAMDRSVGFALKTIGYGVTIGVNAIRLSNSKIHRTTGRINDERIARNAEIENQKTALNNQIINEENERNAIQAHIDDMTLRGDTPTNLTPLINAYEAGIQTRRNDINMQRAGLEAWVAANPADPNVGDVESFIMALSYGMVPAPLATGNPAIDRPTGEIVTKLNQIQRHTGRLNAHRNTVNDFENATNMVAAYDQQITRHQNEMAHWDENHTDDFQELLNYWNMLETGRDSHTGKMYSWMGRKGNQQKRFSKTVAPEIIANAMSHTIAYR